MSKIAVLKLKDRLRQERQVLSTLDTLKQIAIQEFQSLDKKRREVAPFLVLLGSFFNFYKAKPLLQAHFAEMPSQASAVLAVTSDEGFLGSLNNQIVDKAVECYFEEPNSRLIVVGKRGARKIKDMGLDAIEFPGIPFPLEYGATVPLRNYLMREYVKNAFGSVRAVYVQCQSFTRQSLQVTPLLPFNVKDMSARAAERYPDYRRDIEYVIAEPDIQRVLQYTIALCFGRQLFDIFWESKLSEVVARTVELSDRHETLTKRFEKLKIQYMRASHEVIDTGIREVFAGHHFTQKLKAEKEKAAAAGRREGADVR